ncbi:hypothetical protein GWI33_018800 [Rhynchophorus ferrugineus]|uniref:Uncharacterized protein n=1 Tax=Rhynchophorus ferrugineus TaxID=354439 RepID=A0A834HU63_RHYFE|nr:hypothetical protein GWI33_018800 [Rhynchophorus ferrugineus]
MKLVSTPLFQEPLKRVGMPNRDSGSCTYSVPDLVLVIGKARRVSLMGDRPGWFPRLYLGSFELCMHRKCSRLVWMKFFNTPITRGSVVKSMCLWIYVYSCIPMLF